MTNCKPGTKWTTTTKIKETKARINRIVRVGFHRLGVGFARDLRGLRGWLSRLKNELLKLRTATLSRFEIETDRIGQGVEKELAQLEKMGWVESEKIDDSLEPKVYFVSAKAFQLLRFPKKNQILSVSV